MIKRKIINNKIKCSKCLIFKHFSEFNKGKTISGLRSQCRVCDRNYKIKIRYNLTLEEVENYWKISRCEICNLDFCKYGDGHNRHLCFDHNHKTGKLRGILCNACNGALGYMKDDISIIKNAIKYLEKYE